MRLSVVLGLAALLGTAGLVRADAQGARRQLEAPPADGLEQALSTIEQEERGLRAELGTLSNSEESAKRRLLVRGRSMYRLVRVGLLPVGGGFTSLIEHAFKMERARRALDQDMAEVRGTSERRVAIMHKLEELATRKAPLELARESAARDRALAGDVSERKRSFDKAFETSTGAGDYVAVYGGGLGALSGPEGATSTGFRSMRGRLPFPIAGRAEIRTVRRAGATGPGLEMSSPVGTPVRAVFAGRVAFADRYDPFGKIVILDHGDHYYTLMGDLGSVEVRVGDDLSAGAKVGTVGAPPAEDPASGGKPRGPSLYFEVRRGSTAVDPSAWLGL